MQAPFPDERGTVREDERRQDHAEAEAHERDVGHRMEAGDAGLVDERITGDRQARHQRPRGARARVHWRAARRRGDVQGRDPQDDEAHAEPAENGELLAEEGQRDQRNERHAEAARHRIDAREVAEAVRAAECPKVERVDRDARGDERQTRGRRALGAELQEADGRQEQRRERHGGPEKDELVLGSLGQRVPDRVQDGGTNDEHERGAAHRVNITRARSSGRLKPLC